MQKTNGTAARACALILCGLLVIACDGGEIAEDAATTPQEDGGSTPIHAAADGGRAPSAIDAGAAAGTCHAPGAIESVSCGRCGTATRFCTSGGTWEVGPCADEGGACSPGETREGACGRCGTQREVCADTCEWTAIGECAGESGCAPGTLTRSSEGCAAGQRDVRCTDACELEATSECTVDTCGTAGATERVPCGRCGTRQRFCTSALEWEYGPCDGEGVCDPGTSRVDACGRCGTVDMRCTDWCEWSAFGACGDEGECAPGATSISGEGCASGETRPLLCSDTCEYAPSGACAIDVRGERGAACVSDSSCQTGLYCVENDEVSPVCRPPCAIDEHCPAGAACMPEGVCTDPCDPVEGTGCPAGSTCGLAPTSDGNYGWCRPIGASPSGGVCSADQHCAAGVHCDFENPFVASYCRPLCDAAHPCTAGTCTRVHEGIGYCVP